MSGAGELAVISTAATVVLRLAERAYEVLAVTPQIRDLVDTTTQASRKLRNARILRRQRSRLLNQLEKTIIEDAFVATEKAIDIVARIIEPARADMDVSGGLDAGKVGLGNSIVFVIRDASKILVSHQKLMQASSDLNMAIITLNSKTGECTPVSPGAVSISSEQSRGSSSSSSSSRNRLPTYYESQALHRSRERNLLRRESALHLQPPSNTSPISPTSSSPCLSTPSSLPSMSPDRFGVPDLTTRPPGPPRASAWTSCDRDSDKIAVHEAVWSPDAPSPVHAFDVPPIINTTTTNTTTATSTTTTATTTTTTNPQPPSTNKLETTLKGRARSKAWLAEWF